MGDQKTPVAPVGPRTAGAKASARWPDAGEPPSRHGAIARQLSTYSSYKSWAEKMRASWVEAPATEDAAED